MPLLQPRGMLDVSDIATFERPKRGDLSRALPPVILVLAGLLLGVAAIMAGVGSVRIILAGGAAGLLALSLISVVERGLILWRHRTARRALSLMAGRDDRATLLTDRNGALLAANDAARHAAWLTGANSITDAFSRRLADPTARLAPLFASAISGDVARTVVDLPEGRLTLTCRLIEDGDLLLWQGIIGAIPEPPALWLDIVEGRIDRASDEMTARFAINEALAGEIINVPLQGRRAALPLKSGGRAPVFLMRQGEDDARARIHVLPASALRDDLPAAGEASAFDTLPVPILTLAPDGAVDFANRPARDLLGAKSGDPIPAITSLFEGMGRPIAEWLADAVRGRGLGKPEFVRASTPKGEVFLQIALGRALSGDGLVAVLNDATELKTLEAQFVQSQKMQAIGQLAGGVAHDFNNLLTAISGHCDLLLLSRSTKDADYSDLVQISQNANRAAALVGQLLAFSRKQAQRPELIDVAETLGDLTHLLNRLVGETIRLEVSHASRRKFIRADPRQLEQVFMNLVVNARDAMENGGRVRIETRSEDITSPLKRDRAEIPPGEYVVVSLEDEGRGIPPDQLPKIFEPFFTTKRQGEGTGLGLSTVYGIVKQSGGFIFADSVPGRGAKFTLYFPAHEAEEAAATPAVSKRVRSVPRGQGVVLLVEDEAPVRSFAARALRMRGWTVLEAESAEDALDTLSDRTLKVDVFVTDVIMPGRDGPSWVREALDTRADTRVVFVSGYAEENFPEVQASVPNSMFLPKPFTLEQLSRAVSGELIAAE